MKSRTESWEQRRDREIDEFLSHWTWQRVLDAWSNRLNDFNVTTASLFQTVPIHDPQNPTGRSANLSWWPVKSIRKLHEECQRHFDRHPGTVGPIHPASQYTKRGEVDTVSYLWDCREQPEKVAAILIAGSLFSRIESRRAHYPDKWPSIWCVQKILEWAYAAWHGTSRVDAWHPSCTDVLPVSSHDYDYRLDSAGAVIRYLAEEHACLLLTYRAVVIEYVSERDPFIARALDAEYALEEQRLAKWRSEQQERQAREEQRLKEVRRKHPRWGEWESISKAELERLVWTKPTSHLALDFGVSDVAIGKRCKSAGIAKPPPGFWRKVESGQLPHPNGIPVRK